MKLSIIVVAYNSAATIGTCLKSIFDNPPKFPFEVFVVDNASADGTTGVVKRFPRVKLVRNKQNLGFARANNQAIRRSKGEYILLLNSDTELRGRALARMVSFMVGSSEIGILGPKLLFPSGKIQKEVTRFPTLAPMIVWLLRFHRIPGLRRVWPLSSYLCDSMDYERTQEVEHLMGSALLVRRKVFDKIGFFDEDFFFWFEETDLCKRAKGAGWKVVYYPEAKVVHLIGGSTHQLSPLGIQHLWNRSLETYFKKHGRPWEVWILRLFFPPSYLVAIVAWLTKKAIR